jgi:DNA-binding response OmpR family regulator
VLPSLSVDARARCAILVVDDDVAIRESLALLLADEGYTVEQAGDGREALDVMDRRWPSLVLLDLRMPVMDGWAFVEELRKRGLCPRVVPMTAARDARAWAEEIGATTYIGKPFDPRDLLAMIERLCAEDAR